jgi:hypothetical protein
MSAKTEVVNWAEQLAAMAIETAAAEVVTGKFISFRSGQMTYQDAPVPNNELPVVIIDSIFENHLYAEAYDPNNISSPICFAFGRTEAEMKPHEKSKVPQAPTCAECKNLQWGSDPKGGRGKACKQIRRLAMIPADALKTPDKLPTAPIAFARIPVMSVTSWGGYVQQVAAQKLPPLAVVTKMYLKPDPKSQFKVYFEMMARITDGDLLSKLVDLSNNAKKTIDFPYEPPQEEDQQTTAQKAKARRKIS